MIILDRELFTVNLMQDLEVILEDDLEGLRDELPKTKVITVFGKELEHEFLVVRILVAGGLQHLIAEACNVVLLQEMLLTHLGAVLYHIKMVMIYILMFW